MKELLNRIIEITKKHEKIAEISGINYNIFKILNITSEEVRLHSKFISELLNPKGSHGQKSKFLELFIKIFEIENFDSATAKVIIEKSIGSKTETEGGRLDIYLEDANYNSIIIENKIYAKDQENQLLRYYNFKKDNNNIFYLTLFGVEPNKISYKDLKIGVDFNIISYKYDIINWLTECRKEAVEYPLLREGISHYINLIKFLTGQSNNSIMDREIRETIISSPENLKSAILLQQNINDAKIEIQWSFWKELIAYFKEEGINFESEKHVQLQNVRNYYLKSRNKDVYYGLWLKVYSKNDITIHFGIEIFNDIYFGFTIERNGIGCISNNKENEKYREFVLQIDNTYKGNECWLGLKHTQPVLDFRAFNSEAVFNLAEKNYLKEQIEKIGKKSIADIEKMKEYLQK